MVSKLINKISQSLKATHRLGYLFLSSTQMKMKMKMKMQMVLVCVLFLSALPSYHSSVRSYYSDQEALLDFKHLLSLDSQSSLQDWSSHHSLCNWTGIVCSSRQQRVVSLDLTGMSLLGPISPFLGNLTYLTHLELGKNSLYGGIPVELGNLIELRLLLLDNNNLTGYIPPTLGDCRYLTYLQLNANHLSGNIPSQLGLLSDLESLFLADNQLTGTIPSSLGNLPSLIQLALTSNRLSGSIPTELGMLTQLGALMLDENNLTGFIPSTLADCRSLQILSLSGNHLSGSIPSQLGLLSNLGILYLGENQLTGSIPPSLGNLSSLTFLDLSENRLHGGIPIELGMLSQLGELLLDSNYLEGVIPVALFNCTLLQNLTLYQNQLSGHIPWQFSKLSELQRLYLWKNRLTGEIPSSLSNCTKLLHLDLSSNQFRGTIPLEFGNLRQLVTLDLADNHLVSKSSDYSVLTTLVNCSCLERIQLSLNYLTGVLPSSFSRLSNRLSSLLLFSNKIEGSIPSGISNLTMLSTLGLSDNCLKGTIPSSLVELQHLERLFLEENFLNGSIPKSLGRIKSLGLLHLNENMLSGQIPDSLSSLPQLRHLRLHHNQLSGKIPASLGSCQTLELVDLSQNKLRGNIPPELGGLKNLQFYFNISGNLLQGSLLEISSMVMVQAIDVSLNNFSGKIPVALSSCTNLQYLNISWNSFDGPIPLSLTSLKNLEDIDLSNNNLSGAIPMAFQAMQTLKHINLSSNRLAGEVPVEGVFATLNDSAIMGNLKLCGKRINLQPCSDLKQKQQLSVFRKGIVPVVIGIAIFMFVALLVFLYRRRHTDQNVVDLKFNIGPKRISYKELEDVTSGFSQSNLLGVGSFGSVYRGILNNETSIAVKVFNLQDENALQSFNRECNVLKRVRHRNVIKIISACSNSDFKAIILPLMSNGNLDRWLYPEGVDECRLSIFDRLGIAKEIAHGMAYLHHYCFVQVIHCDLKPNNVLLGDDMTPYIADFGITKLLYGNSMDSLTSTNALKGSIGYIAPEYGLGGNVSTKGDVYSYGILLLELVTRRRPTNDMFVEGINLPKWVGMAFPNKITGVVDNNLLRDVNESDVIVVLSCLTQVIQVGLACTRELPEQRPNMMEVVERLERISRIFLGTRSFQLPVDISPFLESTSGPRNGNSRIDENWSTSTS